MIESIVIVISVRFSIPKLNEVINRKRTKTKKRLHKYNLLLLEKTPSIWMVNAESNEELNFNPNQVQVIQLTYCLVQNHARMTTWTAASISFTLGHLHLPWFLTSQSHPWFCIPEYLVKTKLHGTNQTKIEKYNITLKEITKLLDISKGYSNRMPSPDGDEYRTVPCNWFTASVEVSASCKLNHQIPE